MIDFTVETHITRPAVEVFGYIADPNKLSTWQTNTVSAIQQGAGPVELGTRIREVHRLPGGGEANSLVEVSGYEPNRTFALRVVEGTPIHCKISLEPVEGGTLVRFRVHGQLGWATRLVQPLLQPVLRHQFSKYCDTLKRLLESGTRTENTRRS